MRILDMFSAPRAEGVDDVRGVTIDVLTGIVAGIALVLALLILAASLKPAPAGAAPYPLVRAVQASTAA